jgi:hypothetical protein
MVGRRNWLLTATAFSCSLLLLLRYTLLMPKVRDPPIHIADGRVDLFR